MKTTLTANNCRVCLKLASDDPDVLDSPHINLLLKKLNISNEDLPRKICFDCSNFLDELQKFNEKCKNTERVLEELRHQATIMPSVTVDIKEELVEEDDADEPPGDFDRDFTEPETTMESVKEEKVENKIETLEPKVDLQVKKKRKLVDCDGYDFDALETYLLENNIKPGPLEQVVLRFKSPKDRSRLPKNIDKTVYEFDKRYKCEYCNKVIKGGQLSGIEILNSHVRRYHSKSKIVSRNCPDCGSNFTSKVAEENHYEVTQCRGGEKYTTRDMATCSYCDLICPFNKNGIERLKNHFITRHSSVASFECPCCSFITINIEQLRAHYTMRKHTKDLALCRPLQCNFCTFSCCLAANMFLHVQNFHLTALDQLPQCVCGSVELCDDLLLQHLLLRCTVAEKYLALPFKRLLILRDASIPKTIIQKTKCQVCDKEVALKNINKHLLSHEQTVTDQYICDLCGRSYRKKLNLRIHLRKLHLNNLFFTCKFCQREFRDWSTMNYHIKTVHDNSLLVHTCDVCGKRYASLYRLDEHKTLHTKLKPFPCSQCNLSFRKRKQLQFHMSVHTNIRKLVCTVCGKTFKDKKALKQHLRTHEDRAFTCPVCEMTFTVGHTLRIHVTSKHPDFPMPPPGTALRNVDLRKFLPISSLGEFK